MGRYVLRWHVPVDHRAQSMMDGRRDHRATRATGILGIREGSSQVISRPHFAAKRFESHGLNVDVECRQETFGVPTGALTQLGRRVSAIAQTWRQGSGTPSQQLRMSKG